MPKKFGTMTRLEMITKIAEIYSIIDNMQTNLELEVENCKKIMYLIEDMPDKPSDIVEDEE